MDEDFVRVMESNDPNALRKYLVEQIGLEMKSVFTEMIERDVEHMLRGEGGYMIPLAVSRPSGAALLDFASYHPSMWFRNPKPKNHYERMMARRRNEKRR